MRKVNKTGFWWGVHLSGRLTLLWLSIPSPEMNAVIKSEMSLLIFNNKAKSQGVSCAFEFLSPISLKKALDT